MEDVHQDAYNPKGPQVAVNPNTKAGYQVRVAEALGYEPLTATTKLSDFNIDDVPFEKINRWTWLMVGMTGTGKSWLIKYILHALRDVYMYGWVFTHTKHNGFYQQMLPNHLIMQRYDPTVVHMIMGIQARRSIMRGINSYVFIVLDDVASEVQLRYMEATRALAMEGRHYNILTIMTSQHFTTVPTQIRTNARWVAMFKTDHIPSLHNLYEEVASDFVSFEDFVIAFKQNTKDHRCVIVHRDPDAENDTDKYFTCKAPDLSNKTITLLCSHAWGGPRFQKAAEQRKVIKEPIQYSRETVRRMWYQRERPVKNADQRMLTREQLTGDIPEYQAIAKEDPISWID